MDWNRSDNVRNTTSVNKRVEKNRKRKYTRKARSSEENHLQPARLAGLLESQRASSQSDGSTALAYDVYERPVDTPFISHRVIGHGSYAYVEKGSLKSGSGYDHTVNIARKAIVIRQDDEERVLEEIQKEVHAIQALRHRHIIKIITAYRCQTEFSILMPLADCNLRNFLLEPATWGMFTTPDRRLTSLRRWPGCLLQALHYIHQSGYRHTDIKPDNILVRGEDVLITDFGLAKDVLEMDGTGSTGLPGPRTKMYRAPEALLCERRGRSEDVFSLGCVFLEIATVLFGVDLKAFSDFRRNSQGLRAFAENPGKILQWIWYLWAIWDFFNPDTAVHDVSVAVCDLAFLMLEPLAEIRPTPAQLIALVALHPYHYGPIGMGSCIHCTSNWSENIGEEDRCAYATFKAAPQRLMDISKRIYRPPIEALNDSIVKDWEEAKQKWLKQHIHGLHRASAKAQSEPSK